METKQARKANTQAMIGRAGGPVLVGRLYQPRISSQAVSQWVLVPARRCLAIERITQGQVSRYQLRPDVYGPAPQAEPPAPAV